jgi:thymidylate synthase ThyX
MFECTILADSTYQAPKEALLPEYRLTTFQITAPRFILAEINTHKMISKNSASSRAIPVAKSIEAVLDDPFVPAEFGRNQKGMTQGEALPSLASLASQRVWRTAIAAAVNHANALDKLNVHKGLANRVIEPFKWHTCILTGTDWSNFFALRTAENAQPEFRTIAEMMKHEYDFSAPGYREPWMWHLPLITMEDLDPYDAIEPAAWPWQQLAKISAARCARVSYLTHDGKRDPEADIKLADFLMANGHLSPFEHVARPFNEHEWNLVLDLQDTWGPGFVDTDYRLRQVEYRNNLRGWYPLRASIPNEHDFSLVAGT